MNASLELAGPQPTPTSTLHAPVAAPVERPHAPCWTCGVTASCRWKSIEKMEGYCASCYGTCSSLQPLSRPDISDASSPLRLAVNDAKKREAGNRQAKSKAGWAALDRKKKKIESKKAVTQPPPPRPAPVPAPDASSSHQADPSLSRALDRGTIVPQTASPSPEPVPPRTGTSSSTPGRWTCWNCGQRVTKEWRRVNGRRGCCAQCRQARQSPPLACFSFSSSRCVLG